MTPASPWAEATSRGIQLYVENGRLRYRGPQGAMTKDLADALSARKSELVERIRSQKASSPTSPVQAEWLVTRSDGEIESRIKADRGEAIHARLLKGAGILGRLWNSGQRCHKGWSRFCECEPRTDFCRAKLLWVDLLHELAPAFLANHIWTGEEEHFVLLAMSNEQLVAAGITILCNTPGGEMNIIGKDGIGWKTLLDAAVAPDTWGDVVKIQRVFGPKAAKEAS